MKKIRGLIFDMDGTLLDTEKIYFQCWLQSAKELGFPMSEEAALHVRSCCAAHAASITENGLKDVLFNGYNFFGLSMYLLNTVISFIFNVIAAYVVIVLLKTVMGNQKGRTILAVILWFAITNAFNLLGGLITTQLASGLDEGNEVVVTQSSTLFLSTSLHTLFQPAMYLPTMILCIIGSIAGYWLTTWIIEKKLSV